MSAKRRAAPTCIVMVTAIMAACLGTKLSSTEQAAVVISTNSVTFTAPVEVGMSASRLVQFTPAGTGPSMDQVTGVLESCAEFSVTGTFPGNVQRTCGSVNPGPGTGFEDMPVEELPATGEPESDAAMISCQNPQVTVASYNIVFAPVTAGVKNCAITFEGTFGQQTVTVTGTAVPPAFAMRVTPTTINFGDVRVGTDSSRAFISIQNTGSMPLPIESVSEPGSVFRITGGVLGRHDIPFDTAEIFEVRCRPTDTVPYAATVTIISPRVAKADVTLACTGTNSQLTGPAELVALNARHELPVTEVVPITNAGGASAMIVDYQIEAIPGLESELSIVTPGLIGSLPPAETTEVTVEYKAATLRPSMGLGTLNVIQNMPGVGLVATKIPLAGEALAAEVGVDPPAIDFGPICVGRTATPRPVRISATLEGHVEVLGEPQLAAPFSFEVDGPPPPFPHPLAGNGKGSLDFSASFAPVKVGPAEVEVDLMTDVHRTLRMAGEGMPAGITASPGLLDFGALDPDAGPSTGRAILLSNCTDQPLEITDVRREGRHANQFGIASPMNLLLTIPPFGREEFLVVLSPGEPGAKEAAIVFEHAGGPTRVDLVGSTIGSMGLRESYYDCSAGGGGAAAWPIGLALMAVMGRRRRARAR